VRILAGKFKGRKLLGPAGSETRPITSSVKKSLFDMLGGSLREYVVLDLYCGTGTLGLEAMSRGASVCVFAERDRSALARLGRNIRTLGLADRCTIWPGDVMRNVARRLSGLEAPLDLVFLDPPYELARNWSWDAVGEQLFGPIGEALAPTGTVVLRVASKTPVPLCVGELVQHRSRSYGDMEVFLFSPAHSESQS